MSEEKTYPTHRISFSQTSLDARGREKLGSPVEVATVWPRKNGKQGGIIQWHINPQNLGDGAYFMLDNQRQKAQGAEQGDQFDRADAKEPNRDQGLER